MKESQKTIETIVIPNYFDNIGAIEWGDWQGPFIETAFVGFKMNGSRYLLLEIEDDVLPPINKEELVEFLHDFGGTVSSLLGSADPMLIKSKNPLSVGGKIYEFVLRIEDIDEQTKDYCIIKL